MKHARNIDQGTDFIAGGGYKEFCEREVWARPNIYTDTSGRTPVDMIEDYISRYGTERIMFGSDWPCLNVTSRLEVLITAMANLGLSPETRKAILSGNAQRLYTHKREA